MKKHIVCATMASILAMNLYGGQSVKHKNLVQEHITALENQLKAESLYAQDRRKLIGYLRGYFNNAMHGGKKQLKKLTNTKTQRLADSITQSYAHILKTVGNHKQAATNYAQRATGVVALNVRPHMLGKAKTTAAPVRPTAAEPVTKRAAAKSSGGWLGELESMAGGRNETAASSPARGSAGRAGVAAAGAAGAAAGTVAASRAKATKKPVDVKKKQRKLAKKKNKKAPAKKGTSKKRTKPMSAKKKAKKERKMATQRTY